MGQSLVGHEGNTNILSYSAYLPNSGRVEEFLEIIDIFTRDIFAHMKDHTAIIISKTEANCAIFFLCGELFGLCTLNSYQRSMIWRTLLNACVVPIQRIYSHKNYCFPRKVTEIKISVKLLHAIFKYICVWTEGTTTSSHQGCSLQKR